MLLLLLSSSFWSATSELADRNSTKTGHMLDVVFPFDSNPPIHGELVVLVVLGACAKKELPKVQK